MKKRKNKICCVLLAGGLCLFAACSPGSVGDDLSSPSREQSGDVMVSESAVPQENIIKEGIGEVYFLPFQYEALLGTNTLTVCAKKTGLQAGDGELALYRAEDDVLIEKIRFDDAKQVELGTLSDGDRDFVGWDTVGTKAIVVLAQPLLEKGAYYVTLTENCLLDPKTGSGSRAMEKGGWSFGVAGYGLTGGTLLGKDTCTVGQTETIAVKLGDGVTKAILAGYDPEMMQPVVGEVTEDGDLSLTFQKTGATQWNVLLLNEAGETVDGTSIAVTVE